MTACVSFPYFKLTININQCIRYDNAIRFCILICFQFTLLYSMTASVWETQKWCSQFNNVSICLNAVLITIISRKFYC